MHILMSPDEENLYDAMRDLFSRYVMRFNPKYERKGHLVGGPYRLAAYLDDSYLLTTSLYIHLNPVKVSLAESVVDYRWTSSRLYCEDDAPVSFADPSFVLGFLSEDVYVAKERYRKSLKCHHGRYCFSWFLYFGERVKYGSRNLYLPYIIQRKCSRKKLKSDSPELGNNFHNYQ